MTDFTKRMHETIASRFGLGSSFGKTMDEANKGRTESEFRAERDAKLWPDEYWINVFWNHKWNRIETDTSHTSIDDVYEEILAGWLNCQYLHTIKVMKTTERWKRDTSAFDLEDDARAWAKEKA
jgi:hypothetical protein